ncbi:flavin reductase [Nocardia sp. R7R-8]|uniref:flavin reductase n=1 Tax=Nocardia sp. R7R-8 TaxID=3459304 RepID=UPI00403D7177
MTAPTVPPSRIDAAHFRRACRLLPTTVVVVAGMRDGKPIGMVVGTFTTVSLEPLLVGFFGDDKSSTFPILAGLDRHSFSVLDQDDAGTADRFRLPLDQRFEGLDWSVSGHGTPVLASALLTFHTRPHSVVPAGDHRLMLGEVLDMDTAAAEAGRPLLFAEGRMTRLATMRDS